MDRVPRPQEVVITVLPPGDGVGETWVRPPEGSILVKHSQWRKGSVATLIDPDSHTVILRIEKWD